MADSPRRPTATTVEYLQRVLAYQTPQIWRQIPQADLLRQRLVEALVSEALWTASPPLGPTLFRLSLGEPWLSAFRRRRSLSDDLAQALHWIGKEAGLYFAVLPLVTIEEDTSLQVLAEHVTHENLQGLPVPPPDATLPIRAYLLIEGTRVFPLLGPLVHIGRRPDNDLVLSDPRVSRRHAQLRLYKGHYMLIDLGSTGGTTVNGKPIRRTVIYPGDRLSFAGVRVTYSQRSTRPLASTTHTQGHEGVGEQSTLIIRPLKKTDGLNQKALEDDKA